MRPATRTEDDVRAALASLEALAPDAAAVLPSAGPAVASRGGVTRRTVLLAGAAAGVVVAAPFAGRLLTHSPVGDPGPLHPLEFDFTIEPYDGLAARGFYRSPDRGQRMSVRGVSDGRVGGWVVLYPPGFLREPPRATGEQVVVRGRPGLFVTDAIPDLPSGDPATGVVWEPTPDAWAVAYDLGSGDGERAASLRLAEAVRFGRAAPMRVPYRLGAVPGLRVVSGSVERIGFDLAAPVSSSVTITIDGRSCTITATAPELAPSATDPGPPGAPTVDPRYDAVLSRTETMVVSLATVPPPSPLAMPIETRFDLAGALTPADLRDESTWHAPRDAFPGT